jgi:hypothetical protein
MASSNKKRLEEIIRKSLSINVKEVYVEDIKTKERLEYLEDLKPNTVINIHLVPDLGREMKFILSINVDSNLTARQVGVYGSSFPKVAEGEDIGKYQGQMGKCAREIADGINRVSKT